MKQKKSYGMKVHAPTGDSLLQQITNITKAHGFDILAKQVDEFKQENAELKIKLKGAEDRIKALKDFINDVRPKDARVIEMPNCDDLPAGLFEKPGNNDLETTFN